MSSRGPFPAHPVVTARCIPWDFPRSHKSSLRRLFSRGKNGSAEGETGDKSYKKTLSRTAQPQMLLLNSAVTSTSKAPLRLPREAEAREFPWENTTALMFPYKKSFIFPPSVSQAVVTEIP